MKSKILKIIIIIAILSFSLSIVYARDPDELSENNKSWIQKATDEIEKAERDPEAYKENHKTTLEKATDEIKDKVEESKEKQEEIDEENAKEAAENSSSDIGEVMMGANSFVHDGETYMNGYEDENGVKVENTYNNYALPIISTDLYNTLLAIGIVVAVAVGSVLGIKFMTSSVEGQAKIKELLVPYVAGCIVIFGAFGIWKIAVEIFKAF